MTAWRTAGLENERRAVLTHEQPVSLLGDSVGDHAVETVQWFVSRTLPAICLFSSNSETLILKR